jgi:hypothetical protein
MKVLAKDVRVELHRVAYNCDLLLGIYHNSGRPALILVDANPHSLGEPIGVATTNAPLEYLLGTPLEFFSVKDWAENKGLWAQLSQLSDPNGFPLFSRATHRGVPLSLTLGFCCAEVWTLNHYAKELFHTLHAEMYSDAKFQAGALSIEES